LKIARGIVYVMKSRLHFVFLGLNLLLIYPQLAFACEKPIIYENTDCGTAGCLFEIYDLNGFLVYEDFGQPVILSSCHNGLRDIKLYKRTYPIREDGKVMVHLLIFNGREYALQRQYIGK
jgi:hypothetical protein